MVTDMSNVIHTVKICLSTEGIIAISTCKKNARSLQYCEYISSIFITGHVTKRITSANDEIV